MLAPGECVFGTSRRRHAAIPACADLSEAAFAPSLDVICIGRGQNRKALFRVSYTRSGTGLLA